MAGPGATGGAPSVQIGGQAFTPSPDAPPFEQWNKIGGGYEAAWKNVAAQLQSIDPDRIIAELKRQAFEQNPNVPVADAARTVVANASSDALFSSAPNIDIKQIANQIYGIERSDPSRSKAVEAEVMALLETGDQSRLANELKTIRGYVSQADAALAKLGVDAKAARAPEATTVKAEADRLLTEATVTAHMRIPRDAVIVSDIAYSLQKMAEANPKLAQAVRSNLVQRLPPENSADLNRILAGDTSFGEGIIQAIEHPIDGGKGLGKGFASGFIFLGDIFVRGSTYQAAADIERSTALQSLIGNNKDVAESRQLAQGLRDVAARPMIEQLPIHNIAQSGGADVGMAIDVATGVKAVATAAPKLLAKNADEIAEVASKQADEVASFSSKAPFLTGDDFRRIPANGKIDPQRIRFSQDSAGENFRRPYGSVDDFTSDLSSKNIDQNSVSPIRLVEKDGMVFTLDNRRLYAYQKANVEVPYQKLEAIPKRELFKFTTKNDGASISIRRGE